MASTIQKTGKYKGRKVGQIYTTPGGTRTIILQVNPLVSKPASKYKAERIKLKKRYIKTKKGSVLKAKVVRKSLKVNLRASGKPKRGSILFIPGVKGMIVKQAKFDGTTLIGWKSIKSKAVKNKLIKKYAARLRLAKLNGISKAKSTAKKKAKEKAKHKRGDKYVRKLRKGKYAKVEATNSKGGYKKLYDCTKEGKKKTVKNGK